MGADEHDRRNDQNQVEQVVDALPNGTERSRDTFRAAKGSVVPRQPPIHVGGKPTNNDVQ